MRPERNNPLDLNNFPADDHGKQAMEESSTTTAASTDTTRSKKKKGGKEDSSKVYECRFCSLKFCKSQALGGHMNRHRQERETETLNRARQLVYSNEGFTVPGIHMGFRDIGIGGGGVGGAAAASVISPAAGSFQQRSAGCNNISDACMQQYRPLYPRLQTQPAAANPPYMYPSFSPPPGPIRPPPIGDYYIGHVINGSSSQRQPVHSTSYDPNYSCFDNPLGFTSAAVRPPPSSAVGRNGPLRDGVANWSCSYGHGQQRDSTANADRFRDEI